MQYLFVIYTTYFFRNFGFHDFPHWSWIFAGIIGSREPGDQQWGLEKLRSEDKVKVRGCLDIKFELHRGFKTIQKYQLKSSFVVFKNHLFFNSLQSFLLVRKAESQPSVTLKDKTFKSGHTTKAKKPCAIYQTFAPSLPKTIQDPLEFKGTICVSRFFWDDHPPKTLEQLNKQDLDLLGRDA